MAVPFSNTKLRVPRGFQNVLEGLSREVLRSQPKDIYQFGAVYFENLLKIREETGNDPTATGAMLEDRFYNNDSFKQQSLDPSDPQQQEAAMLIQTQYRQHAAERQLEKRKEEDAAVKIQAQYRGHHDRQKVEEMTDDSKQQQEEEVDIDLNDPEVANAAVKIQAGFKGYKARKEVHEMKGKDAAPAAAAAAEAAKGEPAAAAAKGDDLDIDLTDPELNEAATKIQASFRGLQARKDVKELKMAEEVGKNEAEAAIKIQAGIRGHLARKQVHQMKDGKHEEPAAPPPEEEIDIDLNDPEVQAATLKIQSRFKFKMGKKPEPKAPTPPPEEEVDIDLTDPEVEKAAIKIQAGFKGFKQRKRASGDQGKEEQAGGEDKKPEEEGEKKESGATEEIDIDLNDPATEAAALKIQASFRGHKTREELKQARDSIPSDTAGGEAAAAEEPSGGDQEAKAGEEEVVDIDLNDPEVEQAAVKIQAGFKGYKARKEVQSKKEEEGGSQE